MTEALPTSTAGLRSPGVRRMRRVGCGLVLLLAAAATAPACSSANDAGTRRSSTSVTTTSVPTPSTASDADFDKQVRTVELMIHDAGDDPCVVVKAFPLATEMPTPVNAGQTERGVRVLAALFDAAAATAPPDAAADAAVMKQAAADLVAEGAANQWKPAWLMATPKSLGGAKVTQAYSNYQAAVTKSCMTQSTTTKP